MDDVEVCMNVSGSTVTPTPDLSACEESALISRDDSGNVVSPFEAAGLKYLTANSSSGVAGAVVIRAWEGGFFMSDTDFSAMPPFGAVRLSSNDTVQITGYSFNSFAMNRTTAAADQSTSVTAACSATGPALQTTLNESFEITVPEIVTAQQAVSSSTTDMAASIVTNMNAAFTSTGEAAASICYLWPYGRLLSGQRVFCTRDLSL